MTTSLDEKINELLLVLKSKRETLELHQSRSKSSWRTNCSFLLNDSHINLQTVRTSGIVSMVSYLLQQREAEKKACELLNIEFDEPEEDTIGGFVFGLLGRKPEEGDRVVTGSWRFEVTEAEGFRVTRVKATRLQEDGTAVQADE